MMIQRSVGARYKPALGITPSRVHEVMRVQGLRFVNHGVAPSTISGKRTSAVRESQGLLITAWNHPHLLRRRSRAWGNHKVCLSWLGTIHIFWEGDQVRERITRFAYHGLAPSTSSWKKTGGVNESQGLLIMAWHHPRLFGKRPEAWRKHKVCLSWIGTILILWEEDQNHERHV